MYDYNRIKNYILFLKLELGLSVSIHICDSENIPYILSFSAFNCHANRFCNKIKESKAARADCQTLQKKVMEKAKNGPFFGTCRCGVSEFIFPVKKENKTIGFISVSGYSSDSGRLMAARAAEFYGLNTNEILGAYDTLKGEMPDFEKISAVINPLCDMLELSFEQTELPEKESEFAMKVASYIKLNYSQKLTSKDICRIFYCSRSYLSREFNKYKKMSINDYIIKLRLSDAKMLLKSSELSITEIAYSVGFSDANYFTTVFKKKIGVSPKTFRKENKNL